MSVEDREVDRDDVVSFGRVHLKGKMRGYELVLQERGVHDDPYIDFFMGMLGEGEVGGLTHRIVEWSVVGLALLKMVKSSGVMVILVNVHLYNTWSLMYLESILYVSPLDGALPFARSNYLACQGLFARSE